jgi:D-sedoheptulose 7-phosphate isomerase
MEHIHNDEQIWSLMSARFTQSMTIPQIFFVAEAETIAQACWTMARRFHQGGRLLACGNGAWATDAHHVAVEFVHPVIVGKRALPALALTNENAVLGGLLTGYQRTSSFAHQIKVLGRAQDIVIGFSPDGNCLNVGTALVRAQHLGMLTLGLVGYDGGLIKKSSPDFCFVVPTQDLMVLQETHEMLYHVLWELVHVFFEHGGILQ